MPANEFETMKKLIASVLLPVSFCAAAMAQTDYSVLQEAGVGEIRAAGWMEKTLNAQRDGLTGHIEVAGHPFDTEGWGCPQNGKRRMGHWADYEQTAYWADGAFRLGCFIGDDTLRQRVRNWIDYQLDNPRPDGFIGPELDNLWPHVVFFRTVMAEYSISRDPRIIGALSRHYKNAERCRLLIKTDGQDFDFNERTMLHIEMLCWLYRQTGDVFFLEKAEDTYRAFCSQGGPFTMQAFASEEVPIVHSVSSSETLKIPVILYICTGKREYLDAALHGLKKVYAYHGLADGVPSGNEAHDGNRPNEVHETCDVSDVQWMLGYFLQATGDVRWADLMERICFNAAMGVVTKDFGSLQYYASPNQVIAKDNSSPCTFVGGLDRMAYRVAHGPACCNGNMSRMIPLFCSRQWMKKGGDGIVAALYAPSEFTTTVGKKGRNVTIREQTNYPFEDRIRFTVDVARPVDFSLWLRIPAWCEGASVRVNGEELCTFCQPGSFAEVRRTFSAGDVVELHLPMKPRFTRMPYCGISVERGPLLFALPVKARERVVETRQYAGAEYRSCFLWPASAWNYALSGEECIAEEVSADCGDPWNLQRTPVRLKVPARQVLNWQLYRGVFTPDMPSVINPGPCDTLELTPMGTTQLRISVFPNLREIPLLDI